MSVSKLNKKAVFATVMSLFILGETVHADPKAAEAALKVLTVDMEKLPLLVAMPNYHEVPSTRLPFSYYLEQMAAKAVAAGASYEMVNDRIAPELEKHYKAPTGSLKNLPRGALALKPQDIISRLDSFDRELADIKSGRITSGSLFANGVFKSERMGKPQLLELWGKNLADDGYPVEYVNDKIQKIAVELDLKDVRPIKALDPEAKLKADVEKATRHAYETPKTKAAPDKPRSRLLSEKVREASQVAKRAGVPSAKIQQVVDGAMSKLTKVPGVGSKIAMVVGAAAALIGQASQNEAMAATSSGLPETPSAR